MAPSQPFLQYPGATECRDEKLVIGEDTNPALRGVPIAVAASL